MTNVAELQGKLEAHGDRVVQGAPRTMVVNRSAPWASAKQYMSMVRFAKGTGMIKVIIN